MKQEPVSMNIILTKLAFHLFGRSTYKKYADRMPLQGNETVLDFGCGMGAVAYYLKNRLPGINLFCADISVKWLSACCKNLRGKPDVSFLQGEVADLPLAENSFDYIYCHFVLHDIPQPDLERIVPVLAGLLKPGGQLATRDPLADSVKLASINLILERNGLIKKVSRVTDVPFLGNSLENIYQKNLEEEL